MKTAQFSLSQCRRLLRFSCHVPVVCTYGTTTEPCTVVDVSEGGVRIVVKGRLMKGSLVQLHYKTGPRGTPPSPPVRARVVWTGRHRNYCEAGLVWQDAQLFWVSPLLRHLSATPDYRDVRRTRRFKASFHASLRTSSSVADGELTDISLGGAAFNGLRELPLGESVVLSVHPSKGRTLTLDGRVVRHGTSDGTAVGISFDTLSDSVVADLSDVLRRLRSESKSPLVDKRLVRQA